MDFSQAIAHRIVLERIYPLQDVGETKRRLLMWLPEAAELDALDDKLRYTIDTAKTFKNMVKFAWLKSIFDGWPTDFRKHEQTRVCLFCKGAGDETHTG